MRLVTFVCVLSILLPFAAAADAGHSTELWLNGYAVFPTPQNVELTGSEFPFESGWKLKLQGISSDDIAVRFMKRDLKEFHNLQLEGKAPKGRTISLSVRPGAVEADTEPDGDKQAYRLRISQYQINIVGNARIGLFYGVQTFLQLIKETPAGQRLIPECTITDWPALQLRILHWDNLGHQDSIKTLKRFLDWSARFKVNAIGWEITDKFEFPSHPIIGVPGAFTTEQVQEVVDYGLERHIQVIPQHQAPAHMKYVLKHTEFEHLRSDGMKYQACLCDPESYELIADMYQDLIDATQGVDYFFVSTDEVYDPGICELCGHEKPLDPVIKSQHWVDYVNWAHNFMTERNRKMLCWMEYPLLTQHLEQIPNDIIDGVLAEVGTMGLAPMSEEFIREQNRLGIRQLVYISMEGVERVVPNWFSHVEGGRFVKGNLQQGFNAYKKGKRAWIGKPIGSFTASWDAVGTHNEAYWLGWATGVQYSWSPGTPPLEQSVEEFMQIYYGPHVTGMVQIYHDLQEGARFFETSWDRIVSRERPPASHYGRICRDDWLEIPKLPNASDLSFESAFSERYADRLVRAKELRKKNEMLVYKINENIPLASKNRYGLQVFLTLAKLERHHLDLMLGLQKTEELLEEAQTAHKEGESEKAVWRLKEAHYLVGDLNREREETYQLLKSTYELSRYPKGQTVGGKEFVHILCDITDAWNARRPDLSFFTMAEESLELDAFREKLGEIIDRYSTAQGIE